MHRGFSSAYHHTIDSCADTSLTEVKDGLQPLDTDDSSLPRLQYIEPFITSLYACQTGTCCSCWCCCNRLLTLDVDECSSKLKFVLFALYRYCEFVPLFVFDNAVRVHSDISLQKYSLCRNSNRPTQHQFYPPQ